MTYALTWLPTVLRAAGLTVIEETGWQTRGHGDMGTVRGVLCHHTAGCRTGEDPSINTVINGRPDLAGPLAQLVLGRSGNYHMVAAGKAWHAGRGAWQGLADGVHNAELIGIEAENDGLADDPWQDVQMDVYARGCAAILKHLGLPAIMCIGHKEYALPHGRKTDPSFSMLDFRKRVALFMAQ